MTGLGAVAVVTAVQSIPSKRAVELNFGQRHRPGLRLRPGEAAPVQALQDQHEAGPVPDQQLQPVGATGDPSDLAFFTQRATRGLLAPISSAISRIPAPAATFSTARARSSSGHCRRPLGRAGTSKPQTVSRPYGTPPSSIVTSFNQVTEI